MELHVTINSATPGSELRRLSAALLVLAGDAPAATAAPADTTATETPAADTKATKGTKGKTAKEAAAESTTKVVSDATAAAAAETPTEPETPSEPEVTVEQIRAVASQFNSDDTRPHALAILSEYGLASVSKSAELPAPKRAALLKSLSDKLAEVQAAALTA